MLHCNKNKSHIITECRKSDFIKSIPRTVQSTQTPSTQRVDYASIYFPYPTAKIEGQPTYATLNTLQKELQANASSVDLDLGGGDHGYLGLVVKYADYPGVVPFVAPGYPSALTIPAAATPAQEILLCETHLDDLAKYREHTNAEKSI